MDVINDAELASYLSEYDVPTVKIQQAVTHVNGLITEITGERDPIPFRFKSIGLEAAARPLRNPSNALSTTEHIDDWQETLRYAEGDEPPKGGWYITDDERAELLGVSLPGKSRTVGSIRTAVPGYPLGCT